MFKTGLVSISFRSLTHKEIIELCKRSSLPLIEWGSDLHAPAGDTARLKEIAALQAENGISASSYGTYFRLGQNNCEELYSYVKAARILGTETLRLWCGHKNFEDLTADERRQIIGESKKAAAIAKAEGVTFCMECHNKSYTNCADGALELMGEVDSPNFAMYWQPNQYRSLEENCDYAKRISKYVKNLHVFNWEGKNRFPLGEAAEIWRKYLSFFDGSQNLLLEFMPDDSPESLAAESRSLNKILDGGPLK
ncbi:MAG: hypothetical protein E7641_02280 [Ruminococcaceae bacterium]|nr:hypothetical protein [Oscillospiraceae bacterium]